MDARHYLGMIAGLVFMGVAGWMGWQSFEFVASSTSAEGEVVKIQESVSSRRRYRPVVEFTTEDGRTIRFVGSGSVPAMYEKGETVSVLYNPDHPEGAKIDSLLDLWGGPLVLGFFGSIPFLALLNTRAADNRRRQLVNDMGHTGTRLRCKVISVKQDRSIKEDGSYPWRVIAQGDPTGHGALMEFRSQDLWNGRPIGVESVGYIDVLINPTNPQDYVMLVPGYDKT
ncbi:MAG: DUF3592 domain-containing protein [Alphaproteobacteria bacterium]|nr:MAG: DUF3592 domain-containing protein [Alphaproteobacteria bacterium]